MSKGFQIGFELAEKNLNRQTDRHFRIYKSRDMNIIILKRTLFTKWSKKKKTSNDAYFGLCSNMRAVVDMTSAAWFLADIDMDDLSSLCCILAWNSDLISFGFLVGADFGGIFPKSFHPGWLSSLGFLVNKFL